MYSNVIMFTKASVLFSDLMIDFCTAKAIAIYSRKLSNCKVSLCMQLLKALFESCLFFIFVVFKSYFEEHLFAGVSPFSWSGVLDPQSS